MPLTPGARVDAYEILSKLGEGGMGEVYRARDTQLGRDVAIKVLPELFATDAERLARFDREARTLAALNHPNIAHVYGVARVPAAGETSAAVALVMELVEGDDLAVHASRGAMSVADALPIAQQLADALESAHESGIIHRDLKPANIKVRPDGTVKVLDFGLAKAVDPATMSGANAMHSPTMTAAAFGQGTQMGVILGTAAYMAPEQAKGRTVDRRADIWAFGVVLYEMLTGRRAFPGDDVTETLAAVIRDTPSMDALPSNTPRRLRQLIARCLVRDPKYRLRDIGEARLELAAVAASPADDQIVARAPALSRLVPWLAAVVAAAAAGAAIAWFLIGLSAPDVTETLIGRFQLTLPPDVTLRAEPAGSVAVSPDGRTMVFAARKGTVTQLWIRQLDSTDVKPLPGTENGTQPFWSPDGSKLGFFTRSKLLKIDLRTNAVTTIADSSSPGGGTWNADGVILFAPVRPGPLFTVPESGGTPVQVTTVDTAKVESAHSWPHFLPDGRHYLFQLLALNDSGIYASTIDGPERTLVLRQEKFDQTAIQYSSSGHVVYVRNHQLVARRFDVDRLAVSGDEVVIGEGFGAGGPGTTLFSASRNGVLAFRPIGDSTLFQLTWYTRAGVAETTVGAPGPISGLELSRDGRLLALGRVSEKEASIWLVDVARGTPTRFTTGDFSAGPVWFPDGKRVTYGSVRDTPPNPYVRTLDGVETRLGRIPHVVFPNSVTPDGRTVIAHVSSAANSNDLWLFPAIPGEAPRVFLQTPFNERFARLSPDGQWIAYESNESGTVEVYVTTFPTPGRPQRVSTDGGSQARWSQDSKELFFESQDRVMSVVVGASAGGEPSLGTPRTLFPLPADAGDWTVSGDGQRFLVSVQVTPRQVSPVTILMNWPALVSR